MFQGLIRDPSYILSQLMEQDDTSLVAKSDMSIYFPQSWIDSPLAYIDEYYNVLAVVGIVSKGKYAVLSCLTMMKFSPETVDVVNIDDEPYMVMEWNAGGLISPSLVCLKKDTLVYYADNEISSKGKTPAYVNMVDEHNLMDTATKYAGVSFPSPIAIRSIQIAYRARQRSDLTKFEKELLTTQALADKANPIMIPERNVTLSASNTTAKLNGNYFSDSMTSALVNKSKQNESIEDLLMA